MPSSIPRNFLRELYSPENAEIDIVAIHGLNPKGSDEHAEETWTASNKKMWLRDFLPLKLKTARVLLRGYNSNVAFQTSTDGVRDHATSLLNQLMLERKNCMERPIIFICHSLGGLVVKRALVIAQANETFASVKNATYGVVFFGTPHRGGNAASLGGAVASITRFCLRNPPNSLMESLQDSHFASELVEDFRALLESYYFLSFYETLPYGGFGLVNFPSSLANLNYSHPETFVQLPQIKILLPSKCMFNNKLRLLTADNPLAHYRQVVDKKSATLGLSIQREIQIGLDADHSTICKFGAKHDDAYKLVEENIIGLVEKALLMTKGRARPVQVGINIPVVERLRLTTVPKLHVFSVPFMRNTNFTGRGLILAELDRGLAFKEGYQSRVVLYGFGGIGKTQIAVEFAYQAEGRAVYWVSGETDESFARDYMEVAKAAGLALADAKEETICGGVKAWLESKDSGDWLLIVDNFDDVDLEFKLWLPLRNGAVIFTSRDKRATGVINASAAIEVNSMTDSEAINTFARLNASEADRLDGPKIHKLLQLLGNSPLAIAHAAAFIRQTWVSVDDYISMFEHDHNLLADESPGMPRSVIGTLAITAEKIQREQPLAMRLLELMSLLDCQSIPKSLLRGLSWPGLREGVAFAKTIGVLLNYSLVNQINEHEYRLHSLVGLSTRVRMQSATYSTRLTDSIELLHIEFPEGTFENVAQCSLLLPHASSIITKVEPLSMVSRAIRDLEFHMAQHLYERGVYLKANSCARRSFQLAEALELADQDLSENYNLLGRIWKTRGKYVEALEWHQRALAGQEKALGTEHHDTLSTVHNMASVFNSQGKYEDALEWYRRALAGREKALGNDHPNTLDTVDSMASVFRSQGKYEGALEWYRRALAGREKALGNDHPDTLDTVQNMANVFYSQGKYEDALEWYRRALAGLEKALGSDHPSTLNTVRNMANVFCSQGKYEDALKWYRRALAGREKALGSDHPNTLDTVDSMANVFKSQGKYEDALEWYRRALAGLEKALGSDHPSTLNTVRNMANVFCSQGKYEDALKWYRRALAGEEKALGSGHPNTLITVQNMANVFYSQGKYEDALEWYRRALAGEEKALGSDHPSTLDTVDSMASMFKSQGKYEDALEWYRRALAGSEKALGNDHPDTLITVQNMANVFKSQGKYEDALKWYRRALAGKEKALGSDHPSTLNTVRNMANVFYSQGKYEDALKWYRRALAGEEKALGSGHPNTLITVQNMANVFYSQGKYEDALKWYRRALAGKEKALGSDHPSTLDTVDSMASMFKSQGKYEDALEWYRRALAGEEKALGSGHPNTLITVQNMANVFYSQGKYEDALKWYRRALAGKEKALGSDHPSTLDTVDSMASVFKSQGKYEDALEWYRRALAGSEKALGNDHPNTLITVQNMANMFCSQGKYEDALEWYRRALAGLEKALGNDHPNTLRTVRNMEIVLHRQGKYEDSLVWHKRVLVRMGKTLDNNHPDARDIRELARVPWHIRAQETIVRGIPRTIARKWINR